MKIQRKIKYKKGEPATVDDIDIVFHLPLGVRNHKNKNKVKFGEEFMEDDLMSESYFERDCEVIIKW